MCSRPLRLSAVLAAVLAIVSAGASAGGVTLKTLAGQNTSLDGYAALPAVRDYVARKPFSLPSVLGEADVIGAAFEQASGDAFTGTPSYLLFNPKRKLVAASAGEVTVEALEDTLARPRP